MLLQFNTNLLFPSAKPESRRYRIHFCKLLAAANDLITTAKQSTILPNPDDSPDKRCLIEAENLYYFRLACSHIHEALAAFKNCYESGMLEAYRQSMRKEGEEALKRLIHFINDPSKKDIRSYLECIRNYTFHYKELDEIQEGYLVLGLQAHETRYIIMDQAISAIVNKKVSSPFSINKADTAKNITLNIAKIRAALLTFVDHLMAVLYETVPNAFKRENEWPPIN